MVDDVLDRREAEADELRGTLRPDRLDRLHRRAQRRERRVERRRRRRGRPQPRQQRVRPAKELGRVRRLRAECGDDAIELLERRGDGARRRRPRAGDAGRDRVEGKPRVLDAAKLPRREVGERPLERRDDVLERVRARRYRVSRRRGDTPAAGAP
jgi:hypothetical protein